MLGLKRKKSILFLMNQVNNEQRKTLTAEMRTSCYLSITGKDIRFFFFDTFLLVHVPGRMVFFDFRSSSTVWEFVKR